MVRRIDHTEVEATDGTPLGVRVWLPDGNEPAPAVLIATPYRKDDVTAAGDDAHGRRLAEAGIALVRLDARGAGSSGGVQLDEYLPIEQDDCIDTIAWIAAQPWCNGAVGMTGISWGGFAALQVAARRPPALRAVIAACATDDRYATDIHYMGGCLLGSEMVSWGTTMLAYNARPPDPAMVGDRWREMWFERLEAAEPWVHTWMDHQRRDAYWQHGSVGEDLDAIACPVYMVGGWADGYRDAILRFLEGASVPRKGLIGPWGHAWPDTGAPGPKIDFTREAIRWWNRWLRDLDDGVMDEPMLRAWVPAPGGTTVGSGDQPGGWVSFDRWPSDGVATRTWAVGADGLLDGQQGGWVTLDGSEGHGLDAGRWFPLGPAHDLPADQGEEDARSTVWSTAELDTDIAIVGVPHVSLRLRADREWALVAVRLVELGADGTSTLVTRGLLNLTHRDGHDAPTPLDPGEAIDVTVDLMAIGFTFAAGSRIGLAVAPGYWPWAWPSPDPVRLEVDTSASALHLPVLEAIDRETPFNPPAPSPDTGIEILREGPSGRTVTCDAHGVHTLRVDGTVFPGRRRLPDGLVLDDQSTETFTITEGDPLSATATSEWRLEMAHDGWSVRIEANSTMTADAGDFRIVTELTAQLDDERVLHRGWDVRRARDQV